MTADLEKLAGEIEKRRAARDVDDLEEMRKAEKLLEAVLVINSEAIAAALREVSALREALEPLAKAAAVLDMPGAAENTGDGKPFEDDEVLWAGETGCLTVADFRRAARALATGEKP